MLNPRIALCIAAGVIVLGTSTGCANQAADTAPTASPSTASTANDYAQAQAEIYARAQAEADASEQAEAKSDALVAELGIMLDYRQFIGEIKDLLGQASDYADAGDEAGLKGLGNDFVLLSRKGSALEDLPDADRTANRAWDRAMQEYLVVGGSLQVGMFSMAVDSMATANDYLGIVADALDAADA